MAAEFLPKSGWDYLVAQGVFCVMFVGYFWYNQKQQEKKDAARVIAEKEEREYQRQKEQAAYAAQQKLFDGLMEFMRSVAPILQGLTDQVKANTEVLCRVEEKVNGCDTRPKAA